VSSANSAETREIIGNKSKKVDQRRRRRRRQQQQQQQQQQQYKDDGPVHPSTHVRNPENAVKIGEKFA
jgi:transcription initiation factor TFIID subunit TAF12